MTATAERAEGRAAAAIAGRDRAVSRPDLPALRRALPSLLLALSGFAALCDQIVWTETCAMGLGHELSATLAVVTAFFGGLAVGACASAWLLRRGDARLWFAGCEVLIGSWAWVLSYALRPLDEALSRVLGLSLSWPWQMLALGLGTFFLLLPATAAMGVTLPAMARAVQVDGRHAGPGRLSGLYAANTAGAVLGVLTSAFFVIPALGAGRTARLSAAVSMVGGLLALMLLRRGGGPSTVEACRPSARAAWGSYAKFAALGFLGVGYQVLVVRVLAQVTESTVYTFAALLALDLVGTAAGSAAARLWLSRAPACAVASILPLATAAVCLGGAISLRWAPALVAFVHGALGESVFAALGAELAPGLAGLGLPAFFMGALFCHELERSQTSALSLGKALAFNTAASALAPASWGVAAGVALGSTGALGLLVLGYLLLVPRTGWQRWLPRAAGFVLVSGALAWAAARPGLAFVTVPPQGHILSYEEGAAAVVTVVEDAAGVARLRINDRAQEGSSGTLRFDARQAWLPLLLHPAPRQALFLGLGTGVTALAAAEDPSLRVTAVELLPEVVRASALFRGAFTPGASARLAIEVADARRFVRLAPSTYDVIVADNYHPARSGSAALYTVEHFRAIRQRLGRAGVFCQWLPLHQLDRESLRSIVRSFLMVFPQGAALLANNSLETPVLGLVSLRDGAAWSLPQLEARGGSVTAKGVRYGLEDTFAVLGSFLAGPQTLSRWSAGAPPNTDDRPLVAHLAPLLTYAPTTQPRERLLDLVASWSSSPPSLVVPIEGDGETLSRLTAYWQVRNDFLALGRDVHPSASAATMLAELGPPLLALVRRAPDFRPAYDPLLAMARALVVTDPVQAVAWFSALASAAPQRPEAQQSGEELDSSKAGDPVRFSVSPPHGHRPQRRRSADADGGTPIFRASARWHVACSSAATEDHR